MKIWLLAVPFFTGCSTRDWGAVDVRSLKLKAGQKVTTSVKFYSDCEGVITGYHHIYDRKPNVHHYKVSFYCPHIGLVDDIFLPETSLIPMGDTK